MSWLIKINNLTPVVREEGKPTEALAAAIGSSYPKKMTIEFVLTEVKEK
jgi:hypothetical protein